MSDELTLQEDISKQLNNRTTKQGQNPKTEPIKLFIVSGRSGSGKSSVLQILEDFGYYAIDNMPLSLVTDAAKKLIEDTQITKLALGVDIRTPKADLSRFEDIYHTLIERYGNNIVKILYVKAQESVLVARFDANRRVHPLISIQNDGTTDLPNAIKKEIELLRPISTLADIKIDTSTLNIHQLKERVREYIGMDSQTVVSILSFGFKYGLPIDADYVFDVRILPNPHWDVGLRKKTGKDAEVKAFFSEYPKVAEMKLDIYKLLNKWLPEFLYNNRHTVTIAIGCTGGKHRSVFMVESLTKLLAESLPSGMKVIAKHREDVHWGV